MFIVAVVNFKGGCGKTTISTQLAARYAADGHRSLLGDLDRQQSALRWVAGRPRDLPVIEAVELDARAMVLPFGEGRMVIDVPGGMKRKALEVVVRAADALVVPMLPSVFDEQGTQRFLDVVSGIERVRKGRRPVAIVANRVSPRGLGPGGADRLSDLLGFPVVARLSDARDYVSAAATGVTLFDTPTRRVRALRTEWDPLLAFLDNLSEVREQPGESAAG